MWLIECSMPLPQPLVPLRCQKWHLRQRHLKCCQKTRLCTEVNTLHYTGTHHVLVFQSPESLLMRNCSASGVPEP